ncbi:transglycosylase family protein [Cumulibacter manganitolerans]|uniref:transglycosylase family protein n=1 Tax=Cumulibacter manganitolerans TaxID=1884992 RepID=UPI001E48FBE9|nr:transglycosylase family protein [Cumulibacter manganitolerans]
MTARLVRGGIALATMGGALALGFTSPASAADTGIPVLEKIKQCESGGDYQAENPTSTASGAYQFIDSTFQSLKASQGYTHAADAPEAVQDAAAIELYNAEGTAPWAPSASCWQAAGAAGPASQGVDRGASAHAATADSHSAHWGTKHRTSGSGWSGASSTGGSSTDQDADDSAQAPVQQAEPTGTTAEPTGTTAEPTEPTGSTAEPTEPTGSTAEPTEPADTETPADTTGVEVPSAPVQDVPQRDAGSAAVGGTPVATP